MEEVRESYSWGGEEHAGPKIGYDVVTMTGNRGTLARVDVYVVHDPPLQCLCILLSQP